MDKLFLLDAYALIYRAYYALIKNSVIDIKHFEEDSAKDTEKHPITIKIVTTILKYIFFISYHSPMG